MVQSLYIAVQESCCDDHRSSCAFDTA